MSTLHPRTWMDSGCRRHQNCSQQALGLRWPKLQFCDAVPTGLLLATPAPAAGPVIAHPMRRLKRLLALLCCVAAAAAAGPSAAGDEHHHHHHDEPSSSALPRAAPVAGSSPRRALQFAVYAPAEEVVGLFTGFTSGAATTAASGGHLGLGLAAGTAAGAGAAVNTGLVLAGINAACNGCVPKAPVADAGSPGNSHSTG